MNGAEKPIISVSGVRGQIGISLDVRVITRFAMAFGTFCWGQNRRHRQGFSYLKSYTSDMPCLRDFSPQAAMSLMSDSARHRQYSSLQRHVTRRGVSPSQRVIILLNGTASNSHRFSGNLLTQAERDELLRIYETADFTLAPWNEQGTLEISTAATAYSSRSDFGFLHGLHPNVIREAGLKVVIDCGNGAGSVISPSLLRQLGCRVVELNCIADGPLPPFC